MIYTMLGGVGLIVASAWSGLQPHYIWNASASAPIGLYRIAPADRIEVTDLVVVLPPEPLATFLAERGYLPRGVPLMKRVLALPGMTICRSGDTIFAYGTTYGVARRHDRHGRALPCWQGCRVLADGEVFFMNWVAVDSLDGRYFGPLPTTAIVGRAVPIWTFEDKSGAQSVPPSGPRSHSSSKHTSPTQKLRKEQEMPQIGTFTRNEDGYFGNIRTLTLDAKLTILPAGESAVENAPDHRVFCDAAEVGAAWDRTGEKAGAYLSVVIDDPSFAQPVRASLFRSEAEDDLWTLHWNRQVKRDERT